MHDHQPFAPPGPGPGPGPGTHAPARPPPLPPSRSDPPFPRASPDLASLLLGVHGAHLPPHLGPAANADWRRAGPNSTTRPAMAQAPNSAMPPPPPPPPPAPAHHHLYLSAHAPTGPLFTMHAPGPAAGQPAADSMTDHAVPPPYPPGAATAQYPAANSQYPIAAPVGTENGVPPTLSTGFPPHRAASGAHAAYPAAGPGPGPPHPHPGHHPLQNPTMHAATYAGSTVHSAPAPFAPSTVQSAAAPTQPPPPPPVAPAAPAPASIDSVPAIPDALRGVVPQGVDESSFWLGMQAANSTFTTMLLSQLSPAAQSQLLAALLQNVNPFTAASAVAAAVAASGSGAGAQGTSQPQPPQQMVAQQAPAPAPVPPNVPPQPPMSHPAAGAVFVPSTNAAGTPDGGHGHGGPFSQHAHANVPSHPHQSAPGLAREYPTAPPHFNFHALHGHNDSVPTDAHHPAAVVPLPPPPVSGPGWPLTDHGSRDPFQQLLSPPHAPTTTAPPPISLSSPHHTFAPELRLSPASLAALEPFSSDTVETASHATLLHLRTPPGPMDTGPPGAEHSASETAASTPRPPPSLLDTDATMTDADAASTDLAVLLADPFAFCDPLAGGAIQPVSFLPPPQATALESAISHVGGPVPFHLPPCLGDAPMPQDALCPLADGTPRGDTPLALMAMLDIEDFLVDAALAGGGGEGDPAGVGLGVPEPAVSIGFDSVEGGSSTAAAAPRRRRARTKSVVAGGGSDKMEVDGAKQVKAARKRRKTDSSDAGETRPAPPPPLPLLAPMPPPASRSASTTDAGSSAADDEDDEMPEYKCAHCGTTKTPLWRRGENEEVLCNACGLYVKNNKRPRPLTLCQSATVRAPAEPAPPPECANCGTNTTSLWRRSKDGDPWCNACALYYKLHGKTRPATMRATVVKKRNRYPKKTRAKSGSAEPSAGTTPTPTPTPTPAPDRDVVGAPDPVMPATATNGLTPFAPG
ncbi:hypothetical protein AMAG_13851 [Allomyces macrogynus ATCC 38327]|uniref:GATA-type domain-containing protein n=1 Tax=Allomyces macrogynus (strain ATCC 38327) TaxID=578462 RepID=A0A0L0T2W0_ALLM3|nr:hypothetical protein AMAG_13851 [Allomyces macrogynus ATCC 38327]|eukprot:KNE68975.1 hypothetical protein AMAG_13851 [Allomyces macrogynus ATCC 38327]